MDPDLLQVCQAAWRGRKQACKILGLVFTYSITTEVGPCHLPLYKNKQRLEKFKCLTEVTSRLRNSIGFPFGLVRTGQIAE